MQKKIRFSKSARPHTYKVLHLPELWVRNPLVPTPSPEPVSFS